MAANTLSIRVGTASSNACHAKDLGKTTVLDGITYRIVKASATLATAAKKVVIDTLSAGVKQNSVAFTTTAQDYLVAGVVPAGQVGSTGTTSIISGDYFPLIVGGSNVQVLTDATDILAGSMVGTGTVSGRVMLSVGSTSSTTVNRLGISTIANTAVSATLYIVIDRVL